jgi:hypothetical protein
MQQSSWTEPFLSILWSTNPDSRRDRTAGSWLFALSPTALRSELTRYY